jgi:hypothetical protein
VPLEQAPARRRHRGRRLIRIHAGDDHRALGAEARERVALFDRRGGGGAHDWLVVTLLTEPPLLEPAFVEDDELVVVTAGVDATVVPDDDVVPEDLLASAGSWPETSTIVISSQAATNSATEPATIRRRMLRARATRAFRSACPRARAAAPSWVSLMSCTSIGRRVEALRSASTSPVSTA